MNIARTHLRRTAAFRRLFVPPLALLIVGVSLIGCQKVPLLAPTGSTMTLTSTATSLPLNGTTQLVAQVLESAGTPPHTGTQVIFTTTLGTIEPATAETDVNGRAVATFKAGTTSGTANITASSGAASVSGTNAIKIAIGAAAVTSVTASASPAIISAQGGASTISAKVFDAGGNPLASVPVTFATDNGSLSASVATTDTTGVAQVTLTTNRTAKVTATAGTSTTSGGGSGSTPTTTGPANASVTVTVNSTGSITAGTATPANPTVGQTVAIPLTYPAGAAGTSPVTSVRVDWGDGRVQTYNGQPNVITHAFGSTGSFLVSITGVDSFGDTSSTAVSITVGPKPQMTVDIVATGTPTAGNPVVFTVTATPTTGNVVQSVSIDFGDGTPPTTLSGNVKSVVHTYASSGTYAVTATATDTSGASGSGTTVIFVGIGGVNASFTSSAGAAATHTVSFNGSASTTSSGSISSYAWDFGDGSTGTGVTTTHNYAAAGPYNVRLTVTDSVGRTSTTTQQVMAP